MKKRITCLSVSTILVLAAGSALAISHNSSGSTASTSKKAPTFLFAVSAGTGYLKSLGNNQYALTMNLPSTGQVVMFSDRPQRIVKVINAKTLAKIGTLGSNSFAKSPPNAVLSAQGMMPTIVMVTGVKVKGNQATYQLKTGPNEPKPSKLNQALKKITLTIDGSSAIKSPFVTSASQCPSGTTAMCVNYLMGTCDNQYMCTS